MAVEVNEHDPTLSKLRSACDDLRKLVHTSVSVEASLEEADKKLAVIYESLSMASKRVAPLQTLSIANKALDTRINRAISPALALLESFKLSESLQRRLLELAAKLSNETVPKKRLKKLIKYVECVDKLNESIDSISQECEPAIQKLQEVVEFLSRTKATDQYRTQQLKETLITLKALYETEVDAMKFDGLLDEALLNLQDEYENLLLQLRHENIGQAEKDGEQEIVPTVLGSELEIEVLERISRTQASNDCLDICIDIFVKVRSIPLHDLRTYTPEEIDDMEWESLETAISLWIQHFELAVKSVLVSEKNLCSQVLRSIMEGVIWPECFTKIADKIMAVFFRFGEGVARSNKEPQKLFKLLDMFHALEKLKPEFSETFDGEAGADICDRFRELEKLLVHASTKVFWEFGLQIEGNQDGLPPPQDGSVPKLVRYAINYLKYLASEIYSKPMAQVFRIEQSWKAGILSTPETDENLLRDAISNVMEAIQRNIESKRSRYKDKSLSSIFVMNTYWYIYMRTKNTELGKLMGDQYMKKQYKIVAEEAAYLYQKQTWGAIVRLLDKEELKRVNEDGIGAIARGKMEAFMKGLDEMLQRHRSLYKIPDADLRDQMRDVTIKLVVPAYEEFLSTYSSVLQAKSYLSPHSVKGLLGQIFEFGNQQTGNGRSSLRQSDQRDYIGGRPSVSLENSREIGRPSVSLENSREMKVGRPSDSLENSRQIKGYRRSRSSTSDL